MPDTAPTARPRHPDETRPCDADGCDQTMTWTGLPNFSGPVRFRFFRCRACGIRKIPVEPEMVDGWG